MLGNALELTKEVEFGIFSRIAPLGQNKVRCQLIQHLRGPNVAGVNQSEIRPLANDPGVLSFRRTDQVRGQFHHGVRVELGGQPFRGQLDAVARDSRKADFE